MQFLSNWFIFLFNLYKEFVFLTKLRSVVIKLDLLVMSLCEPLLHILFMSIVYLLKGFSESKSFDEKTILFDFCN